MIITEIETQDLASQLAKETITSYEAEDATVATIVSALLAFQVQTPAIAVGTIDGAYSALTRSIKVDGDTILRALYRLRDTVGGYIYVDNDRQLQWASSIGEDKGQQIRYRKNLKGIEREIDYTKLFNRIYAYGAGEGEARIELTAPGYIEDETSQTEWGGIYPAVFVERSITHPDTLLAWANLLLGEYKNPPICYRIDAVDLSKSEELGFSFEALQLGSTITVIDEDLGIDVSVIVVKIEHPDLLHPEQITLELANRTKDITDTLAEVYDTQQLEQHIATKIGAGQVIVKGVFTVIDWVTAGETTIDGGNITAGTIIADAIGAGTITGKTIIISGADGILKSSNYAAGSAGWQVKGDGNAEFNTVIVRGNIQAGTGSVLGAAYITGVLTVGHTQAKCTDPNADETAVNTADDADHVQGYTIISGGKIVTSLLTASNIQTGTLNCSYLTVTNLSASSITTGTLSGDRISGGTITGVVFSQAGGSVIVDSNGIKIKGENLNFYYSTTKLAEIGCTSGWFTIHSLTGGMEIKSEGSAGIILNTNSINYGLSMHDCGWMSLPQRTTAPSSPFNGMMVYNSSTKYLNVYDGTAWWHANRDAGWA